MGKLKPEQAIAKITEWLTTAYGTHLVSLTLYGSMAGSGAAGEHHNGHSDINLLCVLDQIDAERLRQGAEAMRWWHAQGHRAIAVLSVDEVRDAGDVFPIEYRDIQSRRRVLAGRDLFAEVAEFSREYRQQIEHDLRVKLMRLRSHYAAVGKDRKALEQLMLKSASTFVTLFRHALTALGEPLLGENDRVMEAAAERFGFAPEPWKRIWAARRGTEALPRNTAELDGIFAAYLESIQRVERQLEEA